MYISKDPLAEPYRTVAKTRSWVIKVSLLDMTEQLLEKTEHLRDNAVFSLVENRGPPPILKMTPSATRTLRSLLLNKVQQLLGRKGIS